MKNITSESIFQAIVFSFIFILTACSSDGTEDSTGMVNPAEETNPSFIKKSAAVDFSQVKLYEGHVSNDDENLVALNTANLESGDLITVDIELQISGDLEDYALTAQLVPTDVFNRLNPGNTLGDVINENITESEAEGVIDLGGAYIDEVQPGTLHGVIHAKLPLLENDTSYKVVVTPTLAFLAEGKEISNGDVRSVPLIFAEQELIVHKLDAITVSIVNLPDLSVDNEFTNLEVPGRFDENGYTVEPLFQTSVEVDLSTFNDSEEILLSLSWESDSGETHPLGLLTTDDSGNPIIKEVASFLVKTAGATKTTLPVVAYASPATHSALLGEATPIQDVARRVAIATTQSSFKLGISHSRAVVVILPKSYMLKIPLVSEDLREAGVSNADALGFSVLRAGDSRSKCVYISDSYYETAVGQLPTNRTSEVGISECPQSNPLAGQLWRYDSDTKQIISYLKDYDGNNYCLTAKDVDLVAARTAAESILAGRYFEVNLQKCKSQESFSIQVQQFNFENNKIQLPLNNRYLSVYTDVEDISFIELAASIDQATDFFTNSNGVDSLGRLFSLGRSKEFKIGNTKTARVSLNFSGESYLDYMPVLGMTTQGEATLSASSFGFNKDLIDFNFAHKRYLTRKISANIGDTTPVEIGNGAELKLNVLGRSVISRGQIKREFITESLNPVSNMTATLNAEPETTSIANIDTSFDIDAGIKIKLIIGVIPVAVESGFSGEVKLKANLLSQGIGISAGLIENINISAYLRAGIDAFVVSSGIEGEIDLINQALNFSANAGFSAQDTSLSFNVDAGLGTELKLLRGVLLAFVEYYTPHWRPPFFKKVRNETTLYSSPYLFSFSGDIYDTDQQVNILNIIY